MISAFLVLLSVYAAWSAMHAWRLRRAESEPVRRFDVLAFLLQTPLFVLSLVLIWQAGLIDRSLISPAALMLGVVLGHLLFFLSLLATHRVVGDAWQLFCDEAGLRAFLADNPVVVTRFLAVAATEELIYRAAAQELVLLPLTGSPWIAIIVVALLFSVAHDHFFRNTRSGSAEFLAFALLLGVLYHVTGSILLVTLVHVIRNLESVYLEYVALVDETGDPETARQRLEAIHVRRSKSII